MRKLTLYLTCVGSYFTGWCIVARIHVHMRKRELANPSEETLEHFDWQASALIDAMDRHRPLTVCERCLRPYGEHGRKDAHGPGFCIERHYAEPGVPSWEKIESAIYQAAGAGSGAVMQLAPEVVMPDDVIVPSCKQILADLKNGTLQ